MKKYKSIDYAHLALGTYIYAFDKLDGSNIRIEYSPKLSKKTNFTFGFAKFGTRNKMIYKNDNRWGKAIDIFYEKYAQRLDEIFRTDKDFQNVKKITCFFEYYGHNSFAGQHLPNDEMDLVLIDVDLYQKGIMPPRDFIKKFGHLGIPKVIYQGMYTQQLIDDVKNNVYGLDEGVVIKGTTLTKKKGVENTFMEKVKTNEWLQKVREIYGTGKLVEEVNGDKTLLNGIN